MDKNKINELISSCHNALMKDKERRARLQNDVRHIVETFCEPFVELEKRRTQARRYFN